MKDFELEGTSKIDERKVQLEKFMDLILDDEDKPFFVSDETTLYDIYLEEEKDLIKIVADHYKKTISKSDFRIPLWEFLDKINKQN